MRLPECTYPLVKMPVLRAFEPGQYRLDRFSFDFPYSLLVRRQETLLHVYGDAYIWHQRRQADVPVSLKSLVQLSMLR